MMMMADGLLGPCSDQVIEGVTVKVDSDPEQVEDVHSSEITGNSFDNNSPRNLNQPYNFPPEEIVHQEIVETVSVPHIFSTTSAACANCSISFFDPMGNPVYQPIFYMCLDSGSNEAIQISSVIHILFAKKLSKCPKPSADLALCSKCAELVARMYQLYRELDGLSAINSYINSFLGDINQVFLPTPESTSSNTSVTYASYDDSIATAIGNGSGNGNSSLGGAPEICPGTPNSRRASFDASTPRFQKPTTEPPPLTYPSYYARPRSNSFVSQEFQDRKEFFHGVEPETKPKVEIELINASALSNALSHLGTNSQNGDQGLLHQQELQNQLLQASFSPVNASRKRKKPIKPPSAEVHEKPEGTQPVVPTLEPTTNGPIPVPAQDERMRRILNCPEEGCTKVYHGRGANASLRQHIKIVHLKQFPFECTICTKPIATKSMLDTHERTHLGLEERGPPVITPPRPPPPTEQLPSSPCPECGKVFQTEYILSLHLKNHPKEGEEVTLYKCEYENCSKEFRGKSSLRRHEVRHLGGQPRELFCSRCSVYFESRKLLKEHQSSCASDERQFLCKFAANNCKRKFKYKHHLQNHLMFQHKLTAEQARQEVYPGLSVKDWMTSPKKGQRASIIDRPLDSRGSIPSDLIAPSATFDTVQNHLVKQEAHITSVISEFTSQALTNDSDYSLDAKIGTPAPITGIYESSIGMTQNAGRYSCHPYSSAIGIGINQSGDTSYLLQQQMLGMTSVIQETSNAASLGFGQHFPNAFRSPSVIHQNPSVIQQNPTLFQHCRPPPPYPKNPQIDENGRNIINEGDGNDKGSR